MDRLASAERAIEELEGAVADTQRQLEQVVGVIAEGQRQQYATLGLIAKTTETIENILGALRNLERRGR